MGKFTEAKLKFSTDFEADFIIEMCLTGACSSPTPASHLSWVAIKESEDRDWRKVWDTTESTDLNFFSIILFYRADYMIVWNAAYNFRMYSTDFSFYLKQQEKSKE